MASPTSQEKLKKQVMLAGCLVVVLSLLVVCNVRRASVKAQRQQKALSVPPPTAVAPQATETAPSGKETSLATLKEQAKALSWGRDPFILTLGQGEALPTLQLKVSGIIYDPDHPETTYAIINDQVVRIGDDINGIKVIDIQSDAVRLKKFNQEFSLYLYQEQSK